VNPCAFEPDLDLPAVNVAYDPTRFEHNPRHRKRGVGTSAFRDFHTVDKDKYVIVVILVNRANGVFHAHGSSTSDWSAYAVPILEPPESRWDDQGIHRSPLVNTTTSAAMAMKATATAMAWHSISRYGNSRLAFDSAVSSPKCNSAA
jgi:hypothetical protein